MWLLLLFWCSIASSAQIQTYFLNKNFDGLQSIPYEPPTDIECLQAGGKFTFPAETSMCFRARPMSYLHPRNHWSIALAFGTKLESEAEITEGILFAVFDTGPWVGFKRPQSDTYAWIGGGPRRDFHIQVR